MVPQEDLCPIEALQNLARVVPAGPDELFFVARQAWKRPSHGQIEGSQPHQLNPQIFWLGHHFRPLLQDRWRVLYIPLTKSRPGNRSNCRSLALSSLRSLHSSFRTSCLKALWSNPHPVELLSRLSLVGWASQIRRGSFVVLWVSGVIFAPRAIPS
jgi:hypothetical protein